MVVFRSSLTDPAKYLGCLALRLMLVVLLSTSAVHAYQANIQSSIPDSLQPWADWVLQEQPNHSCPFKARKFNQKHCLWPSFLQLNASHQQLSFMLHSNSYAEGWLLLPGGEGFWPVNTFINGEPADVVDVKGRPAVYLLPGSYQIEGVILWQKIPNSLLIPKDTGLVELTVNQKRIVMPRRDKDGRLWLVKQSLAKDVNTEDKLGISVYRHLKDDIPFIVETQVRLEVSGRPREVLLGMVRLPGFELMAVNSPLPARVENDGRLRIQLRPGSWVLNIKGRISQNVTELPLPEVEGIWPSEELWSFEPNPGLRLVRIEGVESIDPQQTSIPDPWKSWKAYRLVPGQILKLVTIRRGDPEPAPNRLQLQRNAWLDFAGEGVLFQDQLTGQLSRDWRLTMIDPYKLGYVTVAGEPQVVTEHNGQRGVELRDAQLNLQAVSYVQQPVGHKLEIPASGWQHDFDQLSLDFNLPPGWRLLAATNADSVRNAWLNKWKVWDVFLLLITTAALIKLRGVFVGLLSAVAFVLIYPEEPLILWLWLNLIAVFSLLKVLKEGSFQRIVVLYGRASALVLVLVCLPFMVTQARSALYPQLERGDYASVSQGYRKPVSAQVSMPPRQLMEEEMVAGASDAAYVEKAVRRKLASSVYAPVQQNLSSIDPNTAAQTGPSVPQWRWNYAGVSWSGPVTKEQTLTLYFLKPFDSRVIALLRVMLLAVITIGLFKGWRSSALKLSGTKSLFSLGFMVVIFAGLFNSPGVYANDFPPEPLLKQLKERLLSANDCTPNCVAVNRARLKIDGAQMTLAMEVNALEQLQIQLPATKSQWQLQAVTINNEYAPMRSKNGKRWIALSPGAQRVVMTGQVNPSQTLELSFPTNVNNLSVLAPNWKVRGIDNGRVLGGAIYLEPVIKSENSDAASDTIPPNIIEPFVRIERTLRLGLNWYVETKVVRMAPNQGAIKLKVPLINGESVTTQNVTAENGLVSVTLSPNQYQFVWYSSLDKGSQIQLSAPAQANWVESWRLESTPIWHVDYTGVAPVKPLPHEKQWLPQWFPLPGESVTLSIAKPKAAPGATTTIDHAKLNVKPGREASSFELNLSLRSSKGTEQRIQLQEKARVLSVTVDGETQPSQEQGTHLVIPINPGEHQLNVQWREPAEDGFKFKSPAVQVDGLLSNIEMTVDVPRSQWVLFVGGPQLGPAVLIWGELLVVILIAIGLARIPGLPLKTYEWVLLAIGLCAGWLEASVIVVIWFLALKKRKEIGQQLSRLKFNLLQIGLGLLTFFALVTIVGVIPMGLMDNPDMGIVGNGSHHYLLRWYQDQAEQSLPSFWWFAVPLWCYRLLMLIWSLWLAVAILRWLKWAWACFSDQGLWKKKMQAVANAQPTPEQEG